MRRFALPVSVLVTAGVLLSGCGGSSSSTPEAAGPPGTTKVVNGKNVPATWPLTGLTARAGQSVALDHPVMVAKMDNTEASSPQMGLGKADMVVEELVEGGLTRLAAFYYSQVPADVGPVRSMRASDIDVVSPVKATMVTSGAANVTKGLIGAAHIPFVTEGSRGFYRSTTRPVPYNLFARLNQVVAAVKTKPATPNDYLPWGAAKDLPKGVKATSLAAQFSGGHTTEWTYTNGSYHNTNSFAPAGDQFPASTVLVLRVKEGDAGYLDPAGNPVPRTLFIGQGRAQVFHGGRMVPATWHKKAAGSELSLTTKKGQLKIPPGHVWIELVPIAGNVTFTK